MSNLARANLAAVERAPRHVPRNITTGVPTRKANATSGSPRCMATPKTPVQPECTFPCRHVGFVLAGWSLRFAALARSFSDSLKLPASAAWTTAAASPRPAGEETAARRSISLVSDTRSSRSSGDELAIIPSAANRAAAARSWLQQPASPSIQPCPPPGPGSGDSATAGTWRASSTFVNEAATTGTGRCAALIVPPNGLPTRGTGFGFGNPSFPPMATRSLFNSISTFTETVAKTLRLLFVPRFGPRKGGWSRVVGRVQKAKRASDQRATRWRLWLLA
ncbi:hypothetical protein PHYSODRAFT_297864 [Phytophthora sojae]|uniref:Uncharacterized protein n=1 Tax=Phytophthora sojae (strain P6497) TaxID=1094619 RepID=G4ZAM4_PHYSP|nr:hypothetical protein PHYSODRAFT_297864 [Phytophthora sojae]EGZ19221.1 hypothetical protein PHYSODRAFT_297864 [Phytophthora sojae]|eukprot:XP_009521938.1 hypothetical protein PHYSODRAFT_297864 [Phytophthora sojae]